MTLYRTIVMDPPWEEYGGGGRGANQHYPLMSTSEIAKTILRSGVDPAPDAHLWTWTTDTFLPDAMGLIERLGFRYVRTLVWVKTPHPPKELDEVLREGWDEERMEYCVQSTNFVHGRLSSFLQIGLGQYLRGSHELCLFATRGKTHLPDVAPPSVIFAPRTEHSAKPDEAFEVFERVSPGPRIEMFSRQRRPGWDAWGLEVDERLERKVPPPPPEQLALGGQP